MHRRDLLAAAGGAAATAAAGCLGDGNDDVALPPPDRRFDSTDVPYPAWGQQLPDVAVEAPLDDRTVAVREVDTPAILTFFYANCRTVCPVLMGTLRNLQVRAAQEGYADQVTFLPVTFDPERDTAPALRGYADRMNVDADAANWHFLRPDGRDRAKAVVEDAFGVAFTRQAGMDGGSEAAGNATVDADADDGNATGDGHAGDGYMFGHTALTVLANADGYVERAYQTKSPDGDRIAEDLSRVRRR